MTCSLSVIVPVYNVEKYLRECMESVTTQTLKNIEIICINDGSKDNSEQILQEYLKQDSRIVIINKNNAGYGAACNQGLRLAKGKYVAILEPDDFVNVKMYEDLFNLAEKHNCDVVKSSFYEYWDYPENKLNFINWEKEYTMPDRVFTLSEYPQFLYFHPSIWTCIYKKSFLSKHNLHFVEAKSAGWVDNPFQVQTLSLAERIFYTPTPYYYYRMTNPTSSSNSLDVTNPFDRTDEIHSFLEQNNIKDEGVMAHLYKRELGYIDTVLKFVTNENKEYIIDKIQKMTSRMKSEIVNSCKHINENEKNIYINSSSKDSISKLIELNFQSV